jgi:hypothetical protein
MKKAKAASTPATVMIESVGICLSIGTMGEV